VIAFAPLPQIAPANPTDTIQTNPAPAHDPPPTKSDQPLCSGTCCKRPPAAGIDLPKNPPVQKIPPNLRAIPTPNLVATMVATPIATAIATTVPGQPEAIPRTKPTAAQAPCTPPPPRHTPHGQPFSFSQPVILKDDRGEDQPGHAVDLPDPGAGGAVRWGRLRPGPGRLSGRWQCRWGGSGVRVKGAGAGMDEIEGTPQKW